MQMLQQRVSWPVHRYNRTFDRHANASKLLTGQKARAIRQTQTGLHVTSSIHNRSIIHRVGKPPSARKYSIKLLQAFVTHTCSVLLYQTGKALWRHWWQAFAILGAVLGTLTAVLPTIDAKVVIKAMQQPGRLPSQALPMLLGGVAGIAALWLARRLLQASEVYQTGDWDLPLSQHTVIVGWDASVPAFLRLQPAALQAFTQESRLVSRQVACLSGEPTLAAQLLQAADKQSTLDWHVRAGVGHVKRDLHRVAAARARFVYLAGVNEAAWQPMDGRTDRFLATLLGLHGVRTQLPNLSRYPWQHVIIPDLGVALHKAVQALQPLLREARMRTHCCMGPPLHLAGLLSRSILRKWTGQRVITLVEQLLQQKAQFTMQPCALKNEIAWRQLQLLNLPGSVLVGLADEQRGSLGAQVPMHLWPNPDTMVHPGQHVVLLTQLSKPGQVTEMWLSAIDNIKASLAPRPPRSLILISTLRAQEVTDVVAALRRNLPPHSTLKVLLLQGDPTRASNGNKKPKAVSPAFATYTFDTTDMMAAETYLTATSCTSAVLQDMGVGTAHHVCVLDSTHDSTQVMDEVCLSLQEALLTAPRRTDSPPLHVVLTSPQQLDNCTATQQLQLGCPKQCLDLELLPLNTARWLSCLAISDGNLDEGQFVQHLLLGQERRFVQEHGDLNNEAASLDSVVASIAD